MNEDELSLIEKIRQKIIDEAHLTTDIKVVVGIQKALDIIDDEIKLKKADE